jgi:Domain of unknown function (DUF397)
MTERKSADFGGAKWRKSVLSGDGECVEIAAVDGAVGVRDSKDQGGPHLVFTPGEWTAFVRGVKAGEFGTRRRVEGCGVGRRRGSRRRFCTSAWPAATTRSPVMDRSGSSGRRPCACRRASSRRGCRSAGSRWRGCR